MKPTLITTLSIITLSIACAFAQEAQQQSKPAADTLSAPQDNVFSPPRKPVNLQLPESIYAVPGKEINVYFDNIVLVINPDNYVFDVTCAKGRNDHRRWRYTPTEEDVGTHDWSVKVLDETGVLAEGSMKVHVAPKNAGEGKEISVLIVGDSLTAATVYPTRIFENFLEPGNPKLKMVGSNGPGYSKPNPNGVAHEGWGGWRWDSFVRRTAAYKRHRCIVSREWGMNIDSFVLRNDPAKYPTCMIGEEGKNWCWDSFLLCTGISENHPSNAASRFINKFNNKYILDFKNYFNIYNNGHAPDFIAFQLGVNDIFRASDENRQATIQRILDFANTLISAARKDAPDSIIGVGLVTPGAKSQDAFGRSYSSGQTRWQYKKNQHALNHAMLEKFKNYPDKKVIIIPTNINLDCENNFPVSTEPVSLGNEAQISRQNNGVHPAPAGYNQIGDTFYAWMKYHLQ